MNKRLLHSTLHSENWVYLILLLLLLFYFPVFYFTIKLPIKTNRVGGGGGVASLAFLSCISSPTLCLRGASLGFARRLIPKKWVPPQPHKKKERKKERKKKEKKKKHFLGCIRLPSTPAGFSIPWNLQWSQNGSGQEKICQRGNSSKMLLLEQIPIPLH